MVRKKVLQDGIVSDKCFRLLRLKHEIQSDAKVLKVVVDEVDVLRLCRSLGMRLSYEGTPVAKDSFDFGLFNPSDYDTDFARFVREKLPAVAGNGSVDGEQLAIGCLFGKQLEVKAELSQMGVWSRECDEGLSPEAQGVYCIENGEQHHRQFLFSLSSSVTCYWMLKKNEESSVQLPDRRVRSVDVRDDLLMKFGQFPAEELFELRSSCDDQFEKAKRRIEHEAYEYAKRFYHDAVRDVSMLFAVKCSGNSPQMDAAFKHYQAFLQYLQQSGIPVYEDSQEYKMLHLPDRIQSQMKVLDTTFQRHRVAFDEVLGGIVRDDPIDPDDGYIMWLLGVMNDDARNAFAWFRRSKPEFSDGFRSVMETHYLPRLQSDWMSAVNQVVFLIQARTTEQRLQQSKKDRETQFELDVEAAKGAAFKRLRELLNKSDEGQLRTKIDRLILNSDGTTVNVEWSKEVEKEPSKVVHMYHLSSSCPVQVSPMGIVELQPGFQLRTLVTVKMSLAIAILVKENETIVRRVRLELQSQHTTLSAEQTEVRKYRRDCSLCSIRASDRRVAFLFGVGEGRLGTVAFCRFNEAFTRVEATHQIEMDITFGLASPLADILLTERSLCAVDGNGDLQSYDVRTRRTSKKVSCGDCSNSRWVGGLMSFADELVVGRARLDENNRLSVDAISNEDHRALPTAALETGLLSEKMTVGSMGDVLYVVDAAKGTIYSSELSVTVRSDAYRIQQSGSGVKSSRQGCLQADPKAKDDDKHWLRVFFHVFEKFPVRSLIDVSLNPNASFSLELGVAVMASCSEDDRDAMDDVATVCTEYFNNLMVDLRRLNKPLSELNLAKKVKCRWSEQSDESGTLPVKPLRDVLVALVSFVPVQICRAEDNMLKLLQDGEDHSSTATSDSASGEPETNGTDASEIAQTIRFGLLSPLLEAWNGRCVVVTSMGKQSTGKSYFLNHLTGTSFAISGSRCTDGAWMSLRFVSADVLLVVLDFEGLGSFERSEQEDIFLSVLNASVSLFTVFRTESRFDKDIDGLFSRFQKGVQLIKNDPRLFRGLLYMNVKDVNMNDRQGVVDELVSKLNAIFEANKGQNFLTEMYAGQLEINCSPPFGTVDYYQCMKNDAARTLSEIVSSSVEPAPGFVTGKVFLDCLRVVLAKISILDWTSMDKSTQNLVIADVKQKLPGILRTGCHVSLPLVADPIIPKHLQEDVLKVGTREKLVISLNDLCEANPGFAANWRRLNDAVPLDSMEDEEFDVGFDVTTLTAKKLDMVQKAIGMLFQRSLSLRGKEYGSSRLTTEDQSDFDSFSALSTAVARTTNAMANASMQSAVVELRRRKPPPALEVPVMRGSASARREIILVAKVTHMCTGSHGCTEVCTVDGICEQKVHLKKSSQTYTGARGSFEYIYQEMNGSKKHCAHVLPVGERGHHDVGHSCILPSSSGQDTVHYCDARCPSCSYYCTKHFGHMGLHATSHGNMQKTYFMAKDKDIDIEDRKYQVGERGTAEMCNLFCTKMGRGHAHYLSCESKEEERCVYTADASKDQRRHCVDELFPPPDKDMDELLHAKFWSSIGWEDPCSEEERALFAKCQFQCNAPEHEEEDKAPSYCLLDAWHTPETKPEGDDGFAYVDGHKFECVHAVDSGKFHNIFVLDSSGSMSGQPWTNLLHACNEFGMNRLKSGGTNDLVSYVTFDNCSRIHYEAEALAGSSQMRIPYSGGGTCFEEGLRAANEVLSRNDFQEYKAVLIFFSDGRPWDIELGFALAKHIRSAYAKYDLKAFVVGFGHVNLSVLERLAVEMGGEYRKVLDADALRTEFQRIAAVLCSSEASLALLGSNDESSRA
uniref:VWFA domain-containing protein n=1 Tax=Phytophthora ramorum TaxID=164328 RepID=H3GXA1_PHYRM